MTLLLPALVSPINNKILNNNKLFSDYKTTSMNHESFNEKQLEHAAVKHSAHSNCSTTLYIPFKRIHETILHAIYPVVIFSLDDPRGV